MLQVRRTLSEARSGRIFEAPKIFLNPAYRVHYIVCDYVERPMDRH
jgi:hypothetical protein